jgi:hypothetical protein
VQNPESRPRRKMRKRSELGSLSRTFGNTNPDLLGSLQYVTPLSSLFLPFFQYREPYGILCDS